MHQYSPEEQRSRSRKNPAQGHMDKAAAAKSLRSCLTVRPHRWQPTRIPCPWDSPGKNTGVGCHFLLQCMKVKTENEVAQLCPTLSDPKDCGLPGSSIHGIFQARVLEWGATAYPTWTKLGALKCVWLVCGTFWFAEPTPFSFLPLPLYVSCPSLQKLIWSC